MLRFYQCTVDVTVIMKMQIFATTLRSTKYEDVAETKHRKAAKARTVEQSREVARKIYCRERGRGPFLKYWIDLRIARQR